MRPLRELLNRIRWDTQFGMGTFTLGYYDRIARQERTATFTSISFDPGGRTFALCNDDGVIVCVPLHRVRTVYKNGVPIWWRSVSTDARG